MVSSSVGYKDILKNIDYNRWGIRSICLIMFGGIFLMFMFPMILKISMKKQLRITPDSKGRPLFVELPFALNFDVYFLNVTNKQEVMNGGKPKLQQVGPFNFDEFKYKTNIEDDSENDTIEYDSVNKFIYRPDKNGAGLTGDEIITIAHPMILGMLLSMNVDRQELLGFTYAAIKSIFQNPEDIFYTGSAKAILFEGVPLDCSSEGFEASAVCAELEGDEYKSVAKFNDTFLQFSLFGNTNDTSLGRYKAKRGKKNIKELGNVLLYNDEPELDAWFGDKCNEIHGSDGTVYRPFMKKSEDYWIFASPLCRSLRTYYKDKAKYKGIRLSRYTYDFDTHNAEEPECFCRDEERTSCPPKGTQDLFPCTGVPISVASPHFLNADPALLAKVDGLSPDESKHATKMDFHLLAGALVSFAVRFQLSFDVVPIEEIDLMQNVQAMHLPFMWVEESNDLNTKFTRMLKYQLVMVLQIVKYLKMLCIFGGVLGIVIASVAYYVQLDQQEAVLKDNIKTAKDLIIESGPEVKTLEFINNDITKNPEK